MPLNEFSHYFVEAKLTSKQRNKLDDTQFGIPSLRKYPLTDKKHVLQAVRFFNKAPEEHKPELARNIVKRAKELNMDWEKWDVLKPYLGKHVKEAYSNELHSTPEADGCIEVLKDVKYDNTSPDKWRLKTPSEVLKLKKGNCHDTSYFIHNRLNGHKRGVLFFIEYADGKQEGGQTHSVCYEKIPHGICVIECSWDGMKGTFPYNDINEYLHVVKRNWKFTKGFDKLYSCEIKNFDKIKPGISLGEYVEIAMKNKEIVMESYGPEDDNDDYESSEPDDCYCESHDINGIVNANMIASRIHEKYKKDAVGHVVGNQNCQLCTWCAEAQFRGRNDMPRPIYSPRDPALEIVGEDIVKNPRRISLKSGFDDFLYHITEANNSRWYCHVKWVDGHGGHEFLILNIDGKPYLMDAQQGKVDKLLETHEYIKDIDWSNSYICRLDTNELNVKLLEDMNDMSKLVPWDAKLDIPYMLKEGLLTEEEAEQYWKEHPDEKPVQEGFFGPSSANIRKTIISAIKLPVDYSQILFSTVNGKSMISQYDNKKLNQETTIHHWLTPNEIYNDIIQRRVQTEIPTIVVAKLKPSGTLSIHNGDENIYMNTKGSDTRFDRSIGTFTDVVNVINGDESVKIVIDGESKDEFCQEYGGEKVLKEFFKIYSDKNFSSLINNFNRYNMSDQTTHHYSKDLRKAAENIFDDPTEDERNGRVKYFMHPDDLFVSSDGDDYGIGFAGVDNADEYLAISCKDGKVYYMSCGDEDRLISDSFVEFLKAFDDGFFNEYLSKPIQEAAVELPENIWMRKAINADRDYIFKVEMETLDEKYKNDPKVVEMIRKDAYDSVRKTRIICHRRNQNENETIGLLQAYQKDDYWYIGEIYLEPPFRGKGIARTILEKEISEHDWLSLDVNKNNKHAIDLYLSLGFKIVDENDEGYRMDLKKGPVQEGAWNDIKNGVNPFSNELVYHVSTEGHYDGQVFKPRVPEYLEKSDENETHFEDTDNPRVCFSPSIEGALNAIIVNLGSGNQMRQLKDLYVYIPEKPLKEYKHRTTRQLVKEKKVFDANITREIWIEEPVRLKEYGVIRIDQVSDYSVKKTVPNKHGNYAQRYRYDFRWHWVIKPKVLKNRPFDYSPEHVSKLIENDLWKFKYGLIKDGRLVTDASESDYDKYWRLSSPEMFDELGGGNCSDFTEWTDGYFDAFGVSCNKYFMDFGDNYHTFVVINYNRKYCVVDGALRHIVKDTPMRTECKSLDECFDFILYTIHKKDPKATLSGIYDFTKEKIDYGTPMKEYINWIKSHAKKVNMSKPTKEEYDMSDLMRDPDILRMIMEAEAAEEDEEKEDKENKEEKNEEKDDVETKDNDGEDTTELKMSLDEIEFGTDTSDIQNEYDTKEVDTLNDLIAAESQALSEYLDAAKTSKVPLLSRLYSDIGDEERFHLEQLLYAKSTLTGERYEPRDPEVRKEYEELMALGMDEETAMTTAVDKFNLRGSEEEVEEEIEEVEEAFNMIITTSDAISLQCAVLQEAMDDKSNISNSLYQESMAFMESMYVMEEVDNLATKQGQKALGTKNPFVLIAQMYRAVYKLVTGLVRKAKLVFQKIRLKDKRRWAWIKKHGIGALFSSGVHLYFYSDKTNKFEIETPIQYLKLIHDINTRIVDMCKLNVDLKKYKVDEFLNKLGISFEAIQTSSIDKAVSKLNGAMLTKTKVVVTDQNKAELERLFFDYTPENYSYVMSGQTDKIKMSKNIYNQMTIILDAFGYCNEETNAVIEGLENIAGGTPGKDSVFNTNPKLYNTCTSAMKTVTKAVNLFTKAVTSDINQILELDKGLREAVQTADQEGDKTELNEYRDAQQKGQNAENAEKEKVDEDNRVGRGSF